MVSSNDAHGGDAAAVVLFKTHLRARQPHRGRGLRERLGVPAHVSRLDNRLFLRSDVHTLFDRGYLKVHPDRQTLLVSPRLRADWGNGEEFYARAATGEPIRVPARRADRPNHDFLEWHADAIFQAL
jgi:hypothetical protein